MSLIYTTQFDVPDAIYQRKLKQFAKWQIATYRKLRTQLA